MEDNNANVITSPKKIIEVNSQISERKHRPKVLHAISEVLDNFLRFVPTRDLFEFRLISKEWNIAVTSALHNRRVPFYQDYDHWKTPSSDPFEAPLLKLDSTYKLRHFTEQFKSHPRSERLSPFPYIQISTSEPISYDYIANFFTVFGRCIIGLEYNQPYHRHSKGTTSAPIEELDHILKKCPNLKYLKIPGGGELVTADTFWIKNFSPRENSFPNLHTLFIGPRHTSTWDVEKWDKKTFTKLSQLVFHCLPNLEELYCKEEFSPVNQIHPEAGLKVFVGTLHNSRTMTGLDYLHEAKLRHLKTLDLMIEFQFHESDCHSLTKLLSSLKDTLEILGLRFIPQPCNINSARSRSSLHTLTKYDNQLRLPKMPALTELKLHSAHFKPIVHPKETVPSLTTLSLYSIPQEAINRSKFPTVTTLLLENIQWDTSDFPIAAMDWYGIFPNVVKLSLSLLSSLQLHGIIEGFLESELSPLVQTFEIKFHSDSTHNEVTDWSGLTRMVALRSFSLTSCDKTNRMNMETVKCALIQMDIGKIELKGYLLLCDSWILKKAHPTAIVDIWK